MHKPAETLERALKSNNDGPHLPPDHGEYPTLATVLSVTDQLASAELRAATRKTACEEAVSMYMRRVQLPLKKAAKDALSENIQAGFALLNSGLKSSFYNFVETVLTDTLRV